jgi:hypothetical protein
MRKQHGRYTIQEEAKKACRELETLSPEEHAERVEENQDYRLSTAREKERRWQRDNPPPRPPSRRGQ